MSRQNHAIYYLNMSWQMLVISEISVLVDIQDAAGMLWCYAELECAWGCVMRQETKGHGSCRAKNQEGLSWQGPTALLDRWAGSEWYSCTTTIVIWRWLIIFGTWAMKNFRIHMLPSLYLSAFLSIHLSVCNNAWTLKGCSHLKMLLKFSDSHFGLISENSKRYFRWSLHLQCTSVDNSSQQKIFQTGIIETSVPEFLSCKYIF
jgi:hypothetical protein